MAAARIKEWMAKTFPGARSHPYWGESGYFVLRPETQRPALILTIKHRDSRNDAASQLGPDDVRLNLGLTIADYKRLFGARPPRPWRGAEVSADHDFASRNRLMPHPVYAWMGWAAIVSPDDDALRSLEPLLAAAIREKVSGR